MSKYLRACPYGGLFCCDFAIAIRSVFFDGASGFVQAGAGIVYDSDAQSEYDETKRKAGAMLLALKEASR